MSLSESNIEEIYAKHSNLIEEGLILIGRQFSIEHLRVDLLFEDKNGDTLAVELKKGIIQRTDVGQIIEYAGALYRDKPLRLMLIGNRVPPSFQHSLEYHGIEWKEFNENQLIPFLEKDDKEVLKGIETPRTSTTNYHPKEKVQTVVNLDKAFQSFKSLKHFVAGEGIEEDSIASWYQLRLNAKKKFARIFSPPQLKELTAEDFESFLYFRNNRAWTNLYRRGKEAVNKINDLKKTIAFLLNESVDIKVRIQSVLSGSYYIRGMGKNIATAILHTCDNEDKYGVWNERTEGGLQKLGRLPIKSYNNGEFYFNINMELNTLKKILGIDLVIVDCFMWYVDKLYLR